VEKAEGEGRTEEEDCTDCNIVSLALQQGGRAETTGDQQSIESQPEASGSLTRGRGSSFSIWSSSDLTGIHKQGENVPSDWDQHGGGWRAPQLGDPSGVDLRPE